jgi:hypothetical protein
VGRLGREDRGRLPLEVLADRVVRLDLAVPVALQSILRARSRWLAQR